MFDKMTRSDMVNRDTTVKVAGAHPGEGPDSLHTMGGQTSKAVGVLRSTPEYMWTKKPLLHHIINLDAGSARRWLR